jgi:biopolymer transport protein ExbD
MEAHKPKSHVFEADEPLPVRKRLRVPVKFQPPLMPLIDVMFTLMLFFLVGTTIRQQEGLIASSLPEKGGGENAPEKVPTVDVPIDVRSIGGGGARYFTKTGQSFDDFAGRGESNVAATGIYRYLEQYREQMKLTPENSQVVIRPTGDVPWQFIVQVYNQAVRAKFTKVGFAPQ